jgi:hypothetical protein
MEEWESTAPMLAAKIPSTARTHPILLGKREHAGEIRVIC